MSTTADSPLDAPALVNLYRQMRLIREFEREAERQYARGNIRGFLHVYSGEEAIGVGAMSTLRPQDYVVSHYRDHGQALARGVSPNAVMAELFGKATGCSGGKGGSMHLFSAERNFMGGYAIVGGQMPIAAGMALASQYRREDRVTLCFFGDGAVNEGEFHETMNLATIWNLPVIFFCENNLYGMGASAESTLFQHKEIYKMADTYGIPSHQVDGNDVLAVRDLMLEVLEQVRNGQGPVFIEAHTYRLKGHSVTDPADYRPEDEVEYWASRDPLPRYQAWLLSESLATEEQLGGINAAVEEEILAAVEFASNSPFPSPEDLYYGVYQRSR